MNANVRNRLGRVPLLLLGMSSLVAGIWGGLVRLPLNLPLPANNANWITFHGPLMVCGFLGTLIGLERAVGLPGRWMYAAPLLTGAGALAMVSGMMGHWPLILITLGSAVFWIVTLRVVKMQPVPFTWLMSAGAFAWLAGNVLWWADWPVSRVVPWWIAFLALTIIGERLDLSRFQRPSRWSAPLLWVAIGVFGAGLLLTAFVQIPGERLLGVGMILLTGWLARFDIARRSLRQTALPRFMASALLAGYGWLALSGLLLAWFSPLTSGLRYDAILHSFFLGFVFSMIFAHAPVIFPAVLMVMPIYTPRFYSHVILLQVGLICRVAGDLSTSVALRKWGAILAALAVALFLVNTVSAFLLRPSPPARKPKP